MHKTRHLLLLAFLGLLLVAPLAWAQGTGRIEGVITRENGSGVGGVTVVVEGQAFATITDSQGRYNFEHVPPGTYTLSFTLSSQTTSESGVEVTAGSTARVSTQVDWEITFAETITVFSASRQVERITEAPSAVTVISEQQIEREAGNGQLPKLLEFTPGAEVTQSGLYDFNFNTRGFNSSLNRRILVLIDGRDPSVPFLGSQEWGALSFPLDDLASVELVRGPGSALYGADAFNGVLNMVTKAPRFSQGGKIQASGGDLSTQRLDFRWAGNLSEDWFIKLTGGYQESDDFTVSRDLASGGPEYLPCTAPGQVGCLEPEPFPLFRKDDELFYGGVRFDKYFASGHVLTFEGGTADVKGPTAVTGIGRVQLLDIQRPWARVNYNTTHWNFLANYNRRNASDQRSLRSGGFLLLDTKNYQAEIQGNTNFGNGKGRIVGGGYFKNETVNTDGTLTFESRDEDFEGIFGQVDWSFSDKVKGVIAARVDDSTLHDTEFSPRAALVYSFNPNHSLRFSFSQAFQVPNYSEFFLQAGVARPLNLSPFEAICAAGGVSCGFDRPVPILAVGNPSLETEDVQSFEVGYSGILGGKAYLTIDLYRNDYENFITDLIIRLNSLLGDINPEFNFYTPPADLPAPLANTLLNSLRGALPPTLFPFLSNSPTGDPIFALLSYVNFGEASAEGVDVGLNYYASDKWVVDFSFSYFDFDVDQQLPEDPVLANTGKYKGSFGLSYVGDKFDASVKYRYTDGFDWNAGVFRGPVPSYSVVSLAANYQFHDSWALGLDVSNLLDSEDYQSFGGDLVTRRALARLSYSW